MTEGFFDPADMAIPQVGADRLCAAMVRIRPKTMLVLDIAESQEQADALARNESHANGSPRVSTALNTSGLGLATIVEAGGAAKRQYGHAES